MLGLNPCLHQPVPCAATPCMRLDLPHMQKQHHCLLTRAVHLLRYPVTLGKFPRRKDPVQVTYGQYGPYVHQGRTNVTLRDLDPDEVTLEQAIEMVRDKEANPKPAFRRGRRGSVSKAGTHSADGSSAPQGSAAGSQKDSPAEGPAGAPAGQATGKAVSKPRKAAGKAAGEKRAAGKAKPVGKKGKAPGKASLTQSKAGGKSAWSNFLAAQMPELKKQQPGISFGDVSSHDWAALSAHAQAA